MNGKDWLTVCVRGKGGVGWEESGGRGGGKALAP